MRTKIELTAKVVAEIAMEYIKDLFPGIEDVELEEITNKVDWYVTLSMPAGPRVIDEALHPVRKYKVIEIGNRCGKVQSMKMR